MDRRAFLIGSTLAVAAASGMARAATPMLSPDEQAHADAAAAYLEGLTEAKGRFTQTDGRGATSTGTLYLKRPGKARFEYDPPSGLLIVSDGSRVLVHDRRLKTFDSYPLGATPLALFLARHVRLDRGVRVTRVETTEDGFRLTAMDARHPAQGSIGLSFASDPVALRGWTVTDAQGGVTRVRVSGFTEGVSLSPGLFVLNDPRAAAPTR